MTGGKFSSTPGVSAEEGIELCRILGLAISNVSMYGAEHSVTVSAVEAAFNGLKDKAAQYGELEFVMGEAGFLVNGGLIETERTTGQLLVNQLTKLSVHDFTLSAPLSRADFDAFIAVLSSAPGSEILRNGFESAISEANLKTIRVKNISYARVDKDADLEKMNFNDNGDGTHSYTPDKSSGSKVFDLDMDLDAGMDLSAFGFEPVAEPVVQENPSLMDDARKFLEQKQAMQALHSKLANQIKSSEGVSEKRRALKQSLLQSGLSEEDWNDLLLVADDSANMNVKTVDTLCRIRHDIEMLAEQGESVTNGFAMSNVLDSIGKEIARITSGTKESITTLAGKVDADRETIAKVEQDARESGIGLNLSREELLESLAEINQELGQSLTVVSSVTDILASGKMGHITDAQQAVLSMAIGGIDKIEKLVDYLSRLSGMPEKLSPDKALIDEAYGR